MNGVATWSAGSSETRAGPWGRWVRRLAHREPGTSLALFRMAVGLTLLATLGADLLAGVVEDVFVSREWGGYRGLHAKNWLVVALGGATPTTAWTLVGAGCLSGVLLVIGLGNRSGALVGLFAMAALFSLNPSSGGSHDPLTTNALWLLVLAPSTATLSADCRIATGSWRSQTAVVAWPRYLAVWQLILVYGSTGLQKLGVEWLPIGGWSAVYYALMLPSWRRWPMEWIAWVYPLTQVLTAATWLFEVGFPLVALAFWFRATRTRPGRLRAWCNAHDLRMLFALAGASFHLGMWVFMNLGPFPWITLSFYACLAHPDEWAALARRVARRVRKTPA